MAKHKVVITGIDTGSLKVIRNKDMVELFKQYKYENDENAREELIYGNLKLVLSMVQRFTYRQENMDDLFQVGCIGLVKAIDNFDLTKDVRFSTYAVPMILGEIKRYLRDSMLLRVSRGLKDIAYKVLQFKESYILEHQIEPTNAQIATALEIEESLVVEAVKSMQTVGSIFDPVHSDGDDSTTILDQYPDSSNNVDINDQIALQEGMKVLNGKENLIINERYFLGKTQTEVADELAISQAQVSRLERSAIDKLKKQMNKD